MPDAEKTLWERWQLNHADNPDPGRGMIFVLQHRRLETVQQIRSALVQILERNGVTIQTIDNKIGIVSSREEMNPMVDDSLVDLTALNHAQVLIERDLQSIAKLDEYVRQAFILRLSKGELKEAYWVVTEVVPSVIEHILQSDATYKVLTDEDRGILERLKAYTEQMTRLVIKIMGYDPASDEMDSLLSVEEDDFSLH